MLRPVVARQSTLDRQVPIGRSSVGTATAEPGGCAVWRTAVRVVAILPLAIAAVSCGVLDDSASTIHADGIELLVEEQWEEAVSVFTEVIDLEPGTDLLVSAHLNRSIALFELGRFEEAMADETVVISLAGDQASHADVLAQAHLNRSRELSMLERWEDALVDAEAVIALQPEDQTVLAMAHYNKSRALYDLSRTGEALDAAADVVNLNPDHNGVLAAAHGIRMAIQFEIGTAEDVIVEATAVIDLVDGDVERLAEAHLYRATALSLLRREAEAEADMRIIIALVPADHEYGRIAREAIESTS